VKDLISLQYLRDWRIKKLLTRVELGAKSGVNEWTIAKLERGETSARISTIGKLADALEITREQLVNENPGS
jgi:transcriptional regulator with XRE-family HTH domain